MNTSIPKDSLLPLMPEETPENATAQCHLPPVLIEMLKERASNDGDLASIASFAKLVAASSTKVPVASDVMRHVPRVDPSGAQLRGAPSTTLPVDEATMIFAPPKQLARFAPNSRSSPTIPAPLFHTICVFSTLGLLTVIALILIGS